MSLKTELDKLIPESITLSEKEKETIRILAQKKVQTPSRKFLWKPILASTIILLMIGFFMLPYIKQNVQTTSKFEVQKVTIPNVDYPSLINASIVDETNEIVYSDITGIYSYQFDTNTQQRLVTHDGAVSMYDVATNENWVVGQGLIEDQPNLTVLNRKTRELLQKQRVILTDVQVVDNLLIYLPLRDNNEVHSYNSIDLQTMEETVIHELRGEGSSSKLALNDTTVAIPEQFTENNQTHTTYFVYDLTSKERLGTYTVPYKYARNVTLTDNKIYAALSNENEKQILGYIDLQDGEFHRIDVPDFDDYAIYENTIALSIPTPNDSNTVKLFELHGHKVEKLPTFNSIRERLVKPRFTQDGTLLVNGEGKDLSMYVVKVPE